MSSFEHPLDLNTRELPFVGSGGRVNRPDEALKANALPETRSLP
jgi:hypothetical protein